MEQNRNHLKSWGEYMQDLSPSEDDEGFHTRHDGEQEPPNQRITPKASTSNATNALTPIDGGAVFPLASECGAGIAALTKLGPQPMSICWAAAT